jgi:hypothetical protein
LLDKRHGSLYLRAMMFLAFAVLTLIALAAMATNRATLPAMRETELYPAIKAFLEAQGFEVKSEIQGCDVVARRADDAAPLIVEMKTAFNLQLVYQAVDRLSLSDTVFLAIARPKRGLPSEAVKLCRRLGLGLMVVAASGSLEVLAEPEPYAPRKNARRQARLLKEFTGRKGDPNQGGSTRTKLMTAYKQDALRCLTYLQAKGPSRLADLRGATRVDRAAAILRDNHYGWFQRAARGVYELSHAGKAACEHFHMHISALT